MVELVGDWWAMVGRGGTAGNGENGGQGWAMVQNGWWWVMVGIAGSDWFGGTGGNGRQWWEWWVRVIG